MNLERIKHLAKLWVPPIFVNAQRSIRRSLDFERKTLEQEVDRLRKVYEARQKGLDITTYVLREGLSFMVSPSTRFGMDHFSYLDPTVVQEMDTFLELAKDKRCFLDIGSLHGVFSLAFCSMSPEKSAYAFEPSPMAFPYLLYHKHANPSLNLSLFQLALSDAKAPLLVDYHWQHMRALGDGAPVSNETLTINTDTGDAICSSLDLAPDLVKIDVEGAEMMVLKGLATTLKQFHPTLLLEVHSELLPRHGTTVQNVLLFVEEIGYSFATLSGASVDAATYEAPSPAERLIATPIQALSQHARQAP